MYEFSSAKYLLLLLKIKDQTQTDKIYAYTKRSECKLGCQYTQLGITRAIGSLSVLILCQKLSK